MGPPEPVVRAGVASLAGRLLILALTFQKKKKTLSNDDNTGWVAGLRSLWFGKHVLELHVPSLETSTAWGGFFRLGFQQHSLGPTLKNQKEGSLSVKSGPSSTVRAAVHT